MIRVDNIAKFFETRELFSEISFSVGPKERVGVVGRNGQGKSTLLKIITGHQEVDEGQVVIPTGYRVGFLPQKLSFSEETALKEAMLGLKGASHEQWRAEKILTGLGFAPESWYQHPDKFSGGYQVRIKLAQVLLSEPQMLLLDEPTNFLDIVSIRWLVMQLQNWPGEALIVSHDRDFLDGFITHTLGLYQRKIKKLPGLTEAFYSFVATERETYSRQRINQDRKRKKAEKFISQFRSSARRSNQAQSRLKQLEKMGVMEEMGQEAVLDFSFTYQPVPAKKLLTMHNVSFGYKKGQVSLIDGLNVRLMQGQKVGVIGKNGLGKSTLLRLLAGEIKPGLGKITSHVGLKQAYFQQAHTAYLDESKTIEQELWVVSPKLSRTRVRSVAGAMLFSGNEALKPVGVLSGGERSRVLLGKVLLQPCNMLLLDEPTHHLDGPSIEAMIEAINNFEGLVVVVSHDEHLLRKTVNRLIVFEESGVRVFEGGYETFLREVGWQEEEKLQPVASSKKTSVSRVVSNKERQLQKEQKRLKKAQEQLERKIGQLERKLQQINEDLVEASYKQTWELIKDLTERQQSLRAEIDFLYMELVELNEK